MAYNVVSNATLWFAHHHLFDAPRRPKMDRRFAEAWDAYRDLNRLFAESVSGAAADYAIVLVQDYHLTLVPACSRGKTGSGGGPLLAHSLRRSDRSANVADRRYDRDASKEWREARSCGFHSVPLAIRIPGVLRGRRRSGPLDLRVAACSRPGQLDERFSHPVWQRPQSAFLIWSVTVAAIVKVDRVEPSKNLLRGFLGDGRVASRPS